MKNLNAADFWSVSEMFAGPDHKTYTKNEVIDLVERFLKAPKNQKTYGFAFWLKATETNYW